MENLEEIDKYINGAMAPDEKKEFESRLEKDEQLRRELQQHLEVLESLKQDGVLDLIRKLEEISSKNRNRTGGRNGFSGSKILLWAAVAVILIGVAAVTLMNVEISKSDIRNKSPWDELKGEVYQLPDFYHSLKTVVVRGTTFRMVRPPDSLVFNAGQEINFIWDYKLDAPLTITIRDNRENKVFSGVADKKQWYILDQSLPDGIYIYTIEEENKLLQVGIIFIARR